MMRSFFPLLVLFILIVSCQNESPQNSVVEKDSLKRHFPDEGFFNARNYPETTFDYKSYFKDIEKIKKSDQYKNLSGNWEDQGPGNMGARINSLAVNPNNENEIYLGYARGGLFKTTDGGATWKDIFSPFSYLAISSVEIDPNDSQTIYLGTGDKNISHYPGIGNGVYKSTNGGETWEHLGLTDASIISRVAVSAQDPNVVYASSMGIPFEKNVHKGIYKSVDAGQNWEQVLFVNDSTGIIDMKIASGNSDIIYATGWNRLRNNNISSVSGPDAKIWRSTDGGANWDMLENGLPEGEFTRIGIDLFGEDGQTILACYSSSGGDEEVCEDVGINFYGIYKSTDGGDSWIRTEDGPDNNLECGFTGGFAWYFTDIVVNPNDVNDYCLSGVNMMRRNPADGNWINMIWDVFIEIGGVAPHVDFHDMVYVGDNLYAGTDGGAYKFNQETGWVDIENISTNQFYRVAYNPHRPDLYYGGLQDNGIVEGNAENINEWDRISGGDGFQILFDPVNPDIYYTESQNGNIWVTSDGGANAMRFTRGLNNARNWDMQYIISPESPDIRYTGTDRMYKHEGDLENDWEAISEDLTDGENDPLGFYEHNITCLSQSAVDPAFIYCGTSDGFVWGSTDKGMTWDKINNQTIPRRWISDIKPSPEQANVVYLSVTGYKNNDFTPHIFRSDDNGSNWISIAGDLPNFAINDMYILPGNDDKVIFAALEIGVYATLDAGVTWERLGDDFPFIQCLDLEYNPVRNQLIVGTFGKGLRTFDLEQITFTSTETPQFDHALILAPNVSSGLINIVSEQDFDSFKIVDGQGQLISELPGNQRDIDVSSFSSGQYYLLSANDKGVSIQQFIKI